MVKFYKKVLKSLENMEQHHLDMTLNDVHAKGMFSIVIDGDVPGKLTRIFVAGKKLKPFDVQLHTHRYSIHLCPIFGNITQISGNIHDSSQGVMMPMFDYKSFLNGGNGLTFDKHVSVEINQFPVPIGAEIFMHTKLFHTMSCSKGSIWVVKECGFETESSKVLGVPFSVDNLYNEPKQFQINDRIQYVISKLKPLIESFENYK